MYVFRYFNFLPVTLPENSMQYYVRFLTVNWNAGMESELHDKKRINIYIRVVLTALLFGVLVLWKKKQN